MNVAKLKSTDQKITTPRAHHALVRCLIAVCAAALLLALGCSQGGSQASGGMSGTGISQGPITAFGSIFVNDDRWNIDGATILVDDQPGLESDLRVGMVVRVEGTVSSDGSSRSATRISFDDEVEGPIDGAPVDVDPGFTKSFVVLGLTVFIHVTDTLYDDGASFAALAANDVVEVSGLVDENGDIRATRVELKGTFQAGVTEGELKGLVQNLNTSAGTFEIGTVLVNYDETGTQTEFDDLAPADLQDGLLVEVEGVVVDFDEIDATRIEREQDGFGNDSADEAEIEGVVANFTSINSDFTISGVPVDGSNATILPAGFVIANGVRVEAEGRLESGRLIAREIKSEEEDGDESSRIEAEITSIDHAAMEFVALGVTVEVDGGTLLRDDTGVAQNFRFTDISAGDWLEIRGRAVADDVIVAAEIRRDDAGTDPDVRLRGPVTALTTTPPQDRALSILGQSVPIYGGTTYADLMDVLIDEDTFFGMVMLDDIVAAQDNSAVDAAILTQADEVDLEN